MDRGRPTSRQPSLFARQVQRRIPPAAGANIRNVNKTKPMLAFENAFFSADQWMRVYLDGQVAVQRTNTQRTNTAIHGPRGEGRDLNYKAAAAAKINKL